MATILWDNSLITGHKGIDIQHRLLIEYIATIYQKLNNEADYLKSVEVLRDLCKHTTMHCLGEELLMKDNQFNDYAQHKAEHKAFIDTLNNLESTIQGSGRNITLKELNDISNWLTYHIKDKDKLLAKLIEQP